MMKTIGDLLAYVSNLADEHGADAPMYTLCDGEICDGAEFYIDTIRGFKIPDKRATKYESHDKFAYGDDVAQLAYKMGVAYEDVAPINGLTIPDWR